MNEPIETDDQGHEIVILKLTLDGIDRRPVSLKTLNSEREAAIKNLIELHGPEVHGQSQYEMTCDDCNHAAVCALAFDMYNTEGECLASK